MHQKIRKIIFCGGLCFSQTMMERGNYYEPCIDGSCGKFGQAVSRDLLVFQLIRNKNRPLQQYFV